MLPLQVERRSRDVLMMVMTTTTMKVGYILPLYNDSSKATSLHFTGETDGAASSVLPLDRDLSSDWPSPTRRTSDRWIGEASNIQ